MFAPVRIPPFTIRWYPEGASCPDPQPGDVLLVDHTTLFARIIVAGEHLMALTQPELGPFAWCDHAAFIRPGADGHNVSEMGPRGYERRDLSAYAHRLYCIIHLEVSDQERELMLENDSLCAGAAYGWAQYPALILQALSGARIYGGWGEAIICSTHVSMVIRGGGFWPGRPDASIAPIHLASLFNADPLKAGIR